MGRPPPPIVDFTGQTVVVTGAGRGLGREYALEFARRGASVVVNDLGTAVDGTGADGSVADAVVEEIVRSGAAAVASRHSVASPDGAEGIVNTAIHHFGRIDALVNNAGILQSAPFEELTHRTWDQMLRVHLDGAFHVSKAAWRPMRSNGGGRIVFIASSAGLFGQPELAHYAAAKAGALGLANVIALEGAPHGILANTVLPFGESRMTHALAGGDANAARDVLDAIRPELVAPLVVYLASRSCDVTHQVFSALGTRYARVFVGLAEGWRSDTPSPSPDDVARHFDAIAATEPYSVPGSIFDELAQALAPVQRQE